MPHLQLDRLRPIHESTDRLTALLHDAKRSKVTVYTVELLDVLAAALFIVGSVCLLPIYLKQLDIFLFGCSLFIIGSAIYVIICTISLVDVIVSTRFNSIETRENILYTFGAWLFLIGSILYVPTVGQGEVVTGTLLGQMCRHRPYFMDREFWANFLFMVGSALFLFASFLNALYQKRSDQWNNMLITAIASCTMIGSLLFVVGSAAFFPQLQCGDEIITLGAWNFIAGSVLYFLGAVGSVLRTHWLLQCDEVRLLLGQDHSSLPKQLSEEHIAGLGASGWISPTGG